MTSFTPAGMLAWKIAATEAGASGHPLIQPVHLLIGVLSLEKVRPQFAEAVGIGADDLDSIRTERATVAEMLAGLRAQAAPLRRALREAAGRGPGARPGPMSRDPASRELFARAEALAAPGPTTTLHLLAAVTTAPDATVRAGLQACGLDAARVAARASAFAGVALRSGGPADRAAAPRVESVAGEGPPPEGTPTIDRYGRDLTALAARGELKARPGRQRELEAIAQTLARSGRLSPLLVGETGVGKTAIVEALACRAIDAAPEAGRAGRRIVELDLTAVVEDAARAEVEERITRILVEAKSHPQLLLFVHEVHRLVAPDGGAAVPGLVRPALARGELRLIGATTPQEYRRHFESAPDLAHRFERIEVLEPDEEETLEILRSLQPHWQAHLGVAIDEAALIAAIELSVRFDTARRLPDKAIALVERAAEGARAAAGAARPVDVAAVARTLAEASGLPEERVLAGTRAQVAARAESLAEFLRDRLLGQEAAVEAVSRRLRLVQASIGRRPGPLAALLLLGPTGVGKTELARLLAEHLFGDHASLVRFDMSEYMEEHSVSRLLGAPPGYVGHDEEGLLVRELRARPGSVVLLEAVERAHPRVLDVFFPVLDEGRVTDVHGRTASSRHALFVLTSNLGQTGRHDGSGFGWDERSAATLFEAEALAEARRFFRPELLGRIDEVVVFRPLGADVLGRLLRRRLDALASAAARTHGVILTFAPEAEGFLAGAGGPEHGARDLQRVVERLVEVPLAGLATSGKLARSPAWRLSYDEGGVYWIPGEA